MDDTIQDCRIAPADGRKDCVVVFFHGYGANGREMAGHVGSRLAALLPSAVLRFPDGPRPVPWGSEGRSWFKVEDMLDAPDGNKVGPRALKAASHVNAYISRVMREEGMPADRVIIAGFSQGATMAFFSALMRTEPVAGVFSISGGALDQLDRLTKPRSKPQVMLLAGEWENSYYSGRQLAEKTHELLLRREFRSSLFFTPANGHDINRRSIEELAAFSRRVLPAPSLDVPDRAPSLVP